MRTTTMALMLSVATLAACTGKTGEAGTQGPAGATGPTGPAGAAATLTSTVLPTGDTHCANGGVQVSTNGSDTFVCNGQPGASVTTTPLSAGDAHCGNGGLKVSSGGSDSYVCNGIPGPLPTVATGGGLQGDGSSASPLAVSFAGTGTAATAARSDHTHSADQLTAGTLSSGVVVPGALVSGAVSDSANLGGHPAADFLLSNASSLSVSGTVTAGTVVAQNVHAPSTPFSPTGTYATGPKPPLQLVKVAGTILTGSGVAGRFDSQQVLPACVFTEGGVWYLYFGGNNGSAWGGLGLATATSPTGPFTASATPVVPASGGQENDNLYHCSVLKDGATYQMFYSATGTDNIWRIFRATAASPAGPWTKQGLLLAPRTGQSAFDATHAAMPTAVKDGATWWLFYAGYNTAWDSDAYSFASFQPGWAAMPWTVGAATGTNPGALTPVSLQPLLRSPFPRPYIWSNTNTAGRFSFGHAPWDRWATTSPSVMKIGSLWVMLYQGDDGFWTQIGAALSYDGQTWTRQGAPILTSEMPSAGSSFVAYPKAAIDGNTLDVFYATYDYAAQKYQVRLATMPF